MSLDWVTNIKTIYHILKTNGLHDVAFEIGEEHVKGGHAGRDVHAARVQIDGD